MEKFTPEDQLLQIKASIEVDFSTTKKEYDNLSVFQNGLIMHDRQVQKIKLKERQDTLERVLKLFN